MKLVSDTDMTAAAARYGEQIEELEVLKNKYTRDKYNWMCVHEVKFNHC